MNELPRTAAQRRLDFILAMITERFDVTAAAVMGKGRSQTVARARLVAMAALHEGLGLSQSEVGEMFNRDRTTVRHACFRLASDQGYQQLLGKVREAFPLG